MKIIFHEAEFRFCAMFDAKRHYFSVRWERTHDVPLYLANIFKSNSSFSKNDYLETIQTNNAPNQTNAKEALRRHLENFQASKNNHE